MKKSAAGSRTPILDGYKVIREPHPELAQVRRWIAPWRREIIENSAAAPDAKIDVLLAQVMVLTGAAPEPGPKEPGGLRGWLRKRLHPE